MNISELFLPSSFFENKETEKLNIVDNMLYHYTSVHGLQGLLKDRVMRFTEIAYLNDRNEYLDVFHIFKEIYSSSKIGSVILKNKIDSFINKINSIDDIAMFDYKDTDVFVFCLSKKRDDLNQWRSYASKGGYCIAIDYLYLEDFCDNNNILFTPCIYDSALKHRIIKDLFDKMIEIRNCYILTSSDNPTEVEEKTAADIFAKITVGLKALAPIFKNHNFHEEAEWRLIDMNPIIGKTSFDFFTRNNLLIPCVKWQLNKWNEFPIKEILIGPLPKQDQLLAVRSVNLLIQNNPSLLKKNFKDEDDFLNTIYDDPSFELLKKVNVSSVPYRDRH